MMPLENSTRYMITYIQQYQNINMIVIVNAITIVNFIISSITVLRIHRHYTCSLIQLDVSSFLQICRDFYVRLFLPLSIFAR
jgi:hypothetical protein